MHHTHTTIFSTNLRHEGWSQKQQHHKNHRHLFIQIDAGLRLCTFPPVPKWTGPRKKPSCSSHTLPPPHHTSEGRVRARTDGRVNVVDGQETQGRRRGRAEARGCRGRRPGSRGRVEGGVAGKEQQLAGATGAAPASSSRTARVPRQARIGSWGTKRRGGSGGGEAAEPSGEVVASLMAAACRNHRRRRRHRRVRA